MCNDNFSLLVLDTCLLLLSRWDGELINLAKSWVPRENSECYACKVEHNYVNYMMYSSICLSLNESIERESSYYELENIYVHSQS